MTEGVDVELLLRQALRPVEPPAELEQRLEATLDSLVVAAADQLEGLAPGSLRHPRTWTRTATAVVVGGGAGAALVALRVHQQHRRRRGNPLARTGRAARDVAGEARRLAGDITGR